MSKSFSIISLIVHLFHPSYDEDGIAKAKIQEPIACVSDDACNTCKDQAANDRCLTCVP